jgi:hypothetical protein
MIAAPRQLVFLIGSPEVIRPTKPRFRPTPPSREPHWPHRDAIPKPHQVPPRLIEDLKRAGRRALEAVCEAAAYAKHGMWPVDGLRISA